MTTWLRCIGGALDGVRVPVEGELHRGRHFQLLKPDHEPWWKITPYAKMPDFVHLYGYTVRVQHFIENGDEHKYIFLAPEGWPDSAALWSALK